MIPIPALSDDTRKPILSLQVQVGPVPWQVVWRGVQCQPTRRSRQPTNVGLSRAGQCSTGQILIVKIAKMTGVHCTSLLYGIGWMSRMCSGCCVVMAQIVAAAATMANRGSGGQYASTILRQSTGVLGPASRHSTWHKPLRRSGLRSSDKLLDRGRPQRTGCSQQQHERGQLASSTLAISSVREYGRQPMARPLIYTWGHGQTCGCFTSCRYWCIATAIWSADAW